MSNLAFTKLSQCVFDPWVIGCFGKGTICVEIKERKHSWRLPLLFPFISFKLQWSLEKVRPHVLSPLPSHKQGSLTLGLLFHFLVKRSSRQLCSVYFRTSNFGYSIRSFECYYRVSLVHLLCFSMSLVLRYLLRLLPLSRLHMNRRDGRGKTARRCSFLNIGSSRCLLRDWVGFVVALIERFWLVSCWMRNWDDWGFVDVLLVWWVNFPEKPEHIVHILIDGPSSPCLDR